MLDFLRKRASSLAIKFILSLIIIVFVLWGVGRMKEKEQNVVGKVGKIEVPLSEYQDAINRLSEGYRMAFGDKFDYKIFKDRIKNEAWDLIVERTILLQKAENLKLKIGDNEVIEEIKKQEAFKENGQFSRERYLAVLNYMKLSPQMYEKDLAKTLLVKKAMALIKNSVTVVEDDVKSYYELKNKKIKAGYVTFDYKDFTKSVVVSPEEEKKYYADNKESFKKPEKAEVSYYFLPYQDFMNIKIEDKELKDYYEENKNEFFQPKSYVLRHIFKAFGKNKEEAKKKIEEAQRLLSKEDFAKIAAKYNDDGTKSRGGFIGEVTIDRLTPKMSENVSVLKKGDRSPVVESEYGYHIIKAEDVKEERHKSFEEVKQEILSILKEKKSRLYAIKKANELKTAIEKGNNLETFKVQTVVVEKENPIFGNLGAMPDAIKTIFTTQEGKVFGPLNSLKGVILGKVNKFDKGYFALEEVAGKVKDALIKKKALELAANKAEEVLKSGNLHKGVVTEWFDPVGALPQMFVGVKELDKDIIKLTKTNKILKKVYKSLDKAYIIYLVEEDIKKWDTNREDCKAFMEEFTNNKRTIYYNDWLKEEKSAIKLEKNESLIQNL